MKRVLQGHSIGLVFYFFNLFEEIPIEMWMRYTPSIKLIKEELNCFTKSKCLL